jgi:adenosylcobinamide-phosphate synthase
MADGEFLAIIVTALLIDAVAGDPASLYRVVPHPVVIFGRAIGFLDRHCNRSSFGAGLKRLAGAAAIVILLALCLWLGYWLRGALSAFPYGGAAEALIISTLIAQNSLYRHVRRVALALENSGLGAGRDAVAMVVGRDTGALDEAGVSRAAIESLAENYSDGVVAPVLWAVLLGLPGIIAFKMLNTADSMIGHRTPRHTDFGMAAARLDDIANYFPARFAALFLWLAALGRGAGTILRDANRHRSPNAGYPEAAMAVGLGLKLSGPRIYDGAGGDGPKQEPWIGSGREAATPADIRAGLRLYVKACLALFALVLIAALLVA